MSKPTLGVVAAMAALSLLPGCPLHLNAKRVPEGQQTVSAESPKPGETLSTLTPTLRWSALPWAEGYELQIAETRNGLSAAELVPVSGGTEYGVVKELTNNERYFWRVRALDERWPATVWNAPSGFTVRWGTIRDMSPASGAELSLPLPPLSWSPVSGANHYEVRVAATAAALEKASLNTTTETAYRPAIAIVAGATYYWQVRVQSKSPGTTTGQAGAWSPVVSLKVVQ